MLRAPTPATGRVRLLGALVLLGITLRLWSYLSNPSLWLDEILLTRGIVETPLARLLTEPLPLDQVAPRGFLLVQFVVVRVLGVTEHALRLVPLLASIAGMVLFRRLAERALVGLAVPFAVAVFAVAVPLLRYAAEVKQYGLDATATILLLLLSLDLREQDASARRLVAIGLVGFAVAAFSQASVLLMAGIGLALLVEWIATRERRLARVLAVTLPLWAAASLASLVAGLRSMTPSTKAFMERFWDSGFMPFPLRSIGDLDWFWERALSLFDDPYLLRYHWAALFVALLLAGIVATGRRRRDVALLMAGPFIITLVAAIAQQYPFRSRLLLFLVPITILAVSAGAEWVRGLFSRMHPALGTLAMAALLIPPVQALAAAPPPYEMEHHRTLLASLQERRRPGDVVLAFPLSRIGLMFYGPAFGLDRGDWRTITCDRSETRAYVLDVDRHRGVPRLWLVSSDARPFRASRSAVRDYLGTIGVRRDSISFPSPSLGDVSLELYDLSDPRRLAAADAFTFPVPPINTDPRPSCREWVMDSYEISPR